MPHGGDVGHKGAAAQIVQGRGRGFGRRGVLHATGLGFVASLVATLVGEARTARAQPVAGKVPEVERLRVTMLTDNFVWPFFAPQQLDGMKVERSSGAERPGVRPSATFTSEWGLSMLAESTLGSQARTVLIDFGYTAEALLTNMRILGVDPSRIDSMVLSHGHFDHFGGLTGLLVATKGQLKPGLPLFVGGEDCFLVGCGGKRRLEFTHVEEELIGIVTRTSSLRIDDCKWFVASDSMS